MRALVVRLVGVAQSGQSSGEEARELVLDLVDPGVYIIYYGYKWERRIEMVIG